MTPLFEPPCLKFCISKALGYGIVVGSAGVKLPQIMNIVKAGTVDGLAGSSLMIEWMASIANFSYFMALGYPFSTWGENFFLFFQNAIIASLYLHHTSGIASSRFALTAVASVAVGITLYTRSIPDIDVPAPLCSALGLRDCKLTCEAIAGGLPVVLMLFGRLPQILQNMRQGHTGTLSFITYLLNVAGAGARIFTVMQELDDKFVLTSVLSGFVQNGILLAQILLLGSGAAASKKKSDAAKKAT